RLSLRTQQILAHETGVADTVDPLGGSYFVEALTQKMVREIRELIRKIDEMGGAGAAIEKGFIQKEIETRAYSIQREIEEKKRVVVGVNRYEVKENIDISLSKYDPNVAEIQIEKLRTLKRARNQPLVKSSLDAIRKASEGEENLIPFFIDAIKAYATLGEICGVLRDVFGEYHPVSTI
ncbi:MAG: methylmalonyl-CoA mutase, partial [Proteobacteria bacterium]|nr:methylmalonyl-CoA mutase [Pseudomonadota bacterium]